MNRFLHFLSKSFKFLCICSEEETTVTVKIRKVCVNILKSRIFQITKKSALLTQQIIFIWGFDFGCIFYKKLKSLSLQGFTITTDFLYTAQSTKLYRILQTFMQSIISQICSKKFLNEQKYLNYVPKKNMQIT